MANELAGAEAFEKEVQGLSAADPFDLIDAVRAAAQKHLGNGVNPRLQPFGLTFAREVAAGAVAGTTTTKTVCATITIPPDTDTDPEDSD